MALRIAEKRGVTDPLERELWEFAESLIQPHLPKIIEELKQLVQRIIQKLSEVLKALSPYFHPRFVGNIEDNFGLQTRSIYIEIQLNNPKQATVRKGEQYLEFVDIRSKKILYQFSEDTLEKTIQSTLPCVHFETWSFKFSALSQAYPFSSSKYPWFQCLVVPTLGSSAQQSAFSQSFVWHGPKSPPGFAEIINFLSAWQRYNFELLPKLNGVAQHLARTWKEGDTFFIILDNAVDIIKKHAKVNICSPNHSTLLQEVQEGWKNIHYEQVTYEVESSLDSLGCWKWLKLFLVGDAGAGKSSISRWLTGEDFESNPSNTDSADVTTTDIRNWKRGITVDTTELVYDSVKIIQKSAEDSSLPPVDTSITMPMALDERTGYPINILTTEHAQKMEQKSNLNKVVDGKFVEKLWEHKKQNVAELPWTLQIWDFGGQEVYYNTHHFFLSEVAIYLLIVDITRPLEQLEERTKFWLRSIRSYAPDAPIVIIATHTDKILEKNLETEVVPKLKAIWDQFQQIDKTVETGHLFPVSCCKEDLLKETREFLQNLAMEKFKLDYPVRWLLFYHALQKEASKKMQENINDNNNSSQLLCLTLPEAQSIADTLSIKPDQLTKILEEFHKLGFILYYPKDKHLRETIFMKPQELVNALRTVITVQQNTQKFENINLMKIFTPGSKKREFLENLQQPNKDKETLKEGKLTAERMERIWSHYPPQVRLQLRALLQRFELAVPDPALGQSEDNCDFLVPCLVETSPSDKQDKKHFPMLFTYKIAVAPPLGLLSRSIVKALNLAKKEGSYTLCELFRKGCTFKMHDGIHVRMDVHVDKVNIRIEKSQARCFLKHEKVISFLCQLDEFFEKQVATFTRLARCTECKIKFETREWEMLCKDCAYKLADNINRNSNNPTRLVDILNSQERIDRLCKILDQGNFWRQFGDKFAHLPPGDLHRMETSKNMNAKFSPSGDILETWQHGVEATVEYFVDAMRTINCETAVQLIMEFLQADS